MTKGVLYEQLPSLGSVSALGGHAAAEAPALRDLFTMHARYVWTTLRRLGVPASELEDLTHDVFLQVHRHLADYDRARPVRPWLFGFAYRIASQNRRRAHRRREVHVETDLVPHGGSSPEELAAVEEHRQIVIQALQMIDLQRRAVFVLYELDGVAIADIAASLKIPANTAYSRLRVARDEFAVAVKRVQSSRRSR
jgi:RNA polymerase sigma-70 factor (ECF subfamily)